MPELPEVETIKNELTPYVQGRVIKSVDLFWEGMVRNDSVADFRRRVTGQRITGLDRRGKYLLLELGSGEVLVIHLRMSGSLLLSDRSDGRFTRAAFHLDDGQELLFRDPRKFGVTWVAADKSGVERKLGPEPLTPGFTEATLAGLLRDRNAPIKALLLDQKLLAGVGNMYADEALYAARIHPLRSGGSLTGEETRRLYKAVREVLTAGITNKGSSVVNYYRPGGELGRAQEEFKVAHGRGKKCLVCGATIERIVVGGRGTYFCPHCQVMPG
ncbi:MAG: bifunctional DNA-formamidopyrimidine glycosylase/DNA-(apurinic or apyrimidinic site) lyase [Chloroflexota bacterium]